MNQFVDAEGTVWIGLGFEQKEDILLEGSETGADEPIRLGKHGILRKEARTA